MTQGRRVVIALLAAAAVGAARTAAAAPAQVGARGTAHPMWVTASGTPCTNTLKSDCEYRSCKEEELHTGNSCGPNGTTKCRVFYYCDCRGPGAAPGCTSGSDANSGLSPSSPRRNLSTAAAQFARLNRGDTIAFCRGGSFSGGTTYWQDKTFSASNPVIIRDYTGASWQTGSEPRPKMPGPFRFWSVTGVRALNLDVNNAGSDSETATSSDVTVCNWQIHDGNLGFYVVGKGSENTRIKLVGSRITNISNMGWIGSGQFIEVRDNYFNNASGFSTAAHTMYWGGSVLSNGGVVSGNEIHPPAGATGAQMNLHGIHLNLLVENNQLIYDNAATYVPSAYGLCLQPGYGGQGLGEKYDHAIVRGNLVVNAGGNAIVTRGCIACLLENNLVVQTNGTRVNGIISPDMATSLPDTSPSTYSTVRNNTVYLSAGGTGIMTGVKGSGYYVANNVVYSPSGTCFNWQGSAGAYTERDYNFCWGHTEAPVGPHSRNDVDPHWVNAPSDLRPAPGSPLIGASDPNTTCTVQDATNQRCSASLDASGETRPATASVGAFEP